MKLQNTKKFYPKLVTEFVFRSSENRRKSIIEEVFQNALTQIFILLISFWFKIFIYNSKTTKNANMLLEFYVSLLKRRHCHKVGDSQTLCLGLMLK